MTNLLQQFLTDWNYTRGKTFQYLESMPEAALAFSPGDAFGTIGRQLRHIADVQGCYLRGMHEGRIDFTTKRRDDKLLMSKELLLRSFKDLDALLKEYVASLAPADLDRTVEWQEFGNPPLFAALTYMKEHEIYHQGILQVSAGLAGIETVRFY